MFIRLGATAIGAVILIAVLALSWLYWPVSSERYPWQQSVDELIDQGACHDALSLLRRLGDTGIEGTFERWRDIRLVEGCRSAESIVDPAQPLTLDEDIFIRQMEGRTWVAETEPFNHLYSSRQQEPLAAWRQYVFRMRCGRTILSRPTLDEFTLRESVMEMGLGTDLLSPWRGRIDECARRAYRMAAHSIVFAETLNGEMQTRTHRRGFELAHWAASQGHVGAVRLGLEGMVSGAAIEAISQCPEQVEALRASEYWWAHENLKPYLGSHGWAQRLNGAIWELGVLSEPRYDLAYNWYLRAAESGEDVQLELQRLEDMLNSDTDELYELVQNGGSVTEPDLPYPGPPEIVDCVE